MLTSSRPRNVAGFPSDITGALSRRDCPTAKRVAVPLPGTILTNRAIVDRTGTCRTQAERSLSDQRARMNFHWTDEENAFRERLREFLARNLPANWEDVAGHGPGSAELTEFSRTFCGRLADEGLLTPHWPGELGGQGLGPWHQQILAEEMWVAGEPRGAQYMNINWIGPTLIRYGTAEQRERYLPKIAAGDAIWCQGFSEPGAGSDLASLRTRAVLDGDQYRVSGQKIWTSYAGLAETCFLL